jgi:hypothetical protein
MGLQEVLRDSLEVELERRQSCECREQRSASIVANAIPPACPAALTSESVCRRGTGWPEPEGRAGGPYWRVVQGGAGPGETRLIRVRCAEGGTHPRARTARFVMWGRATLNILAPSS